MRKTIGIVLLVCYMAVLGVLATAEYFYQTGKSEKDAAKLKLACALNPFFSDYRAALFQQTRNLDDIKGAIALEPLKPAYHMYYGLELLRDSSKRTRASDQLAYRELQKAAQLKPYSETYRQTFEQYAKPYLK